MTTTAQEYLAYLQRTTPNPYKLTLTNAEISENILPGLEWLLLGKRTLSPPEHQKMRSSLREWLEETKSSPVPTELEDPFLLHSFQVSKRDVAKAIEALGYEIPDHDIVIGSLPTGEFNALTIRVPDNPTQYIVAVNHGIHFLIYRLAHLVASLFPVEKTFGGYVHFSNDKKKLRKSVEKNPDRSKDFLDLLCAFFFLGHPLAVEYFPEKYGLRNQFTLGSCMKEVAFKFVVAHEYAHVLLGHLGGETHKQTLGNQEVETTLRPVMEEMEADIKALEIVLMDQYILQPLENNEIPSLTMSYLGVDFLFSCQAIIEEAAQVSDYRSHPPADVRREVLRACMMERYNGKPLDVAIETCTSVTFILEQLWERNKGAFSRLMHGT